MDSALTGGITPSTYLGFIAQYWDNDMLPLWVKSLTYRAGIYGLAINPGTNWIIAHTSWASPNIILVLDPNGLLKGAYTFAGITNYHHFF